MTLTTQERNYLLNSSVRECKVKFWLFTALSTDYTTDLMTGTEIAAPLTTLKPAALISPPWSLVAPGESIILYAGDSYYRTGSTPATGHSWSLVSGSATLSPSASSCTVTPTGGEDSEVVVRCTVTGNGITNYRDAHIACSTNGWAYPTGTVSIQGSYAANGWSGSIEVTGETASGLAVGKILLIHIDTIYDGAEYTIGGYKRANNLCVLLVKNWDYYDGPDGHKVCRVNLVSPAELIDRDSAYFLGGLSAAQPLFFNDVGGNTPATIVYSTLSLPIVSYHIAVMTPVSKDFNVTIWDAAVDGARQDDTLWVDIGGLFQQICDPIRSVLGVGFMDWAGSINCIPHPAVRADEWWGTPDQIWDSTNPLTTSYCTRQISYYPNYPPGGGGAWDGLILSGYQSSIALEPTSFAAGTTTTGSLVNREYTNYLLAGQFETPPSIAGTWASDLLSFVNRTWDVTCEFFCLGNTLNIGSFVSLSLPPEQAGQPTVSGTAYCDAIEHTIDVTRKMQFTRATFRQLTGQLL